MSVPARAIRFTHTFGLGGASLVLLSLLGLTGLLLTLGYQPVPGTAYDSVVGIERDVMFGTLVRGMHHWSANLLVLVMVAHAARVFLTGGYHGPRQFNWVVGVFLVVLVGIAMPLKYIWGNGAPVMYVGILHGWLYPVLLISSYNLYRRVQWPWQRLLAIALAGTVPFLSFVAEHAATKDVRARVERVRAG